MENSEVISASRPMKTEATTASPKLERYRRMLRLRMRLKLLMPGVSSDAVWPALSFFQSSSQQTPSSSTSSTVLQPAWLLIIQRPSGSRSVTTNHPALAV